MNDLIGESSILEPVNSGNANDLVKKVQKLAELKKVIDEQYKQLRERLLDITKETGVITLKTEDYTITRNKRVTPSVYNLDEAISELVKRDVEVKTVTTLDASMMPVLKLIYERDPQNIPGVEFKETEYISIRTK